MRTVYNLLQASLKLNISELIEDAMSETQSEYINLQKEQMFAGIQSDGAQINRLGASYQGYAPSTIKAKQKKGQPTDRVTLKDKEDFYNGIFAETRSEGFNVDSLDEKSAKLQTDYGLKIFGLNDEYRSQYAEILMQKLLARVFNVINSGVSVSQNLVAA
jgi:hypothetical protein